MYEFGDELTIESYRIPWLIWIQLLVLFLLFFLLFCFGFFASDSSDTNSSSSSSSGSPSTSGLFMSHDPNFDKSALKLTNSRTTATTVTNRYRRTQAGETHRIKGERTTNIGRRIVTDDLASSSEDTNFIDYHPCNYFRLAKLAFLKCLGKLVIPGRKMVRPNMFKHPRSINYNSKQSTSKTRRKLINSRREAKFQPSRLWRRISNLV